MDSPSPTRGWRWTSCGASICRFRCAAPRRRKGTCGVDDLAATFGAVHVAAGGVLEQTLGPRHGSPSLRRPERKVSVAARQPARRAAAGAAGHSIRRGLRGPRPFRLRHPVARRSPARLRRQGPVPRHRRSLRACSRALRAAVHPPDLSSRRIDRRGDHRTRVGQLDAARRDQPVHAGCRPHDRRRRLSASITASTAHRSARRSSPT